VFFRKCADVLKPGGRIALQVITIPDGRYDASLLSGLIFVDVDFGLM
jgi:cyclopropane fatty-acyl-phospholipid synthase-like methyltransferase